MSQAAKLCFFVLHFLDTKCIFGYYGSKDRSAQYGDKNREDLLFAFIHSWGKQILLRRNNHEEDTLGFTPYVYLDVTDGYALWEKAIDHHWFAVHSASFPYKEHYSHLKRLRGIQGRKGYCECFMLPPEQVRLTRTLEEI